MQFYHDRTWEFYVDIETRYGHQKCRDWGDAASRIALASVVPIQHAFHWDGELETVLGFVRVGE